MSVNYLSMVNADGTSLGQSTTELISLYGVTPIAQRTNAAQAAVTTTVSISSSSVGGERFGASPLLPRPMRLCPWRTNSGLL